MVNSRYWNRKELWRSSSSSNLLLLALILHNIECRLIIIPRPYSNKLRWRVIAFYDYTHSSFRFQYRLLTMTTFSEIAVWQVVSRINPSNNSPSPPPPFPHPNLVTLFIGVCVRTIIPSLNFLLKKEIKLTFSKNV